MFQKNTKGKMRVQREKGLFGEAPSESHAAVATEKHRARGKIKGYQGGRA